MYVYWKPLFLLGIVFWIILLSTDVLRRQKFFESLITDSNVPESRPILVSTHKATVDKKKSLSIFLEATPSDKLGSEFGLPMIFINIVILVVSIFFCSVAKFVVTTLRNKFRKSGTVQISEYKKTVPIDTFFIGDSVRRPDIPIEEQLIKTESSSNTRLKQSTDQICQTIFHTAVPLKYDQTLREECTRLKEELTMVQSNSIKEHALLCRKLDGITKEKRDLTKRLCGSFKENIVAKAQIEEIMEEKKLVQKRLDNAMKDSRLNMKTKKVTLAKLEEISATVDDLRRQLEQVTRDKQILQGKLQVLRGEYEKIQERMRMMQIKETNRINEERAIILELAKAEKDQNVVELSSRKTNEDQSVLDSSQSSLKRIMSKEPIFLPYEISETEIDMKNIQMKILQLENSIKGLGTGTKHLQEISIPDWKSEADPETDQLTLCRNQVNAILLNTMTKSPEEAEELDEKHGSIFPKIKITKDDFTPGKSYDEIKLQLLRSALKEKIKCLENMKDKGDEFSRSGCLPESTEEDLEMFSEATNSSPRLVSNSEVFQRFLKNIGAEATVVNIGDTKLITDSK